MNARVLVFGNRPGDRNRAGRTVRSLRQAGVDSQECCGSSPRDLAAAIAAVAGPVWLVRAGAWPTPPGRVEFPPPSATGLPLCALGMLRAEQGATCPSDPEVESSAAIKAHTGGDFSFANGSLVQLPPVASLYLEAGPARELAERLLGGAMFSDAIHAELGSGRFRVVHFAPLDVHDDLALRVVQVVTSLQQGGAERVTLDLTEALPRFGVRCRVVSLGQPMRMSFTAPAGTVDLSHLSGNRRARREAVAQAARAFAADLVHGHLIDRDDAAALVSQGFPLLMTVHNMRPGWPKGLAEIAANEAHLLVACAQAVERDLRRNRIPVPVRTAWNGIEFQPFENPAASSAAAADFRMRLGFDADDFILLALANPRPQKRLHLLPAVLAATRAEFDRRGIGREARLVLAGQVGSTNDQAACAEETVRADVVRLGMDDHVRWTGSSTEVPLLLAAVDALVSTSAYEGLSLAQLEALAAERPVVATDVGGVAEVARDNPAFFRVPPDTSPAQFASILADIACQPPKGGRAAACVHFTRWRMAERYRWLYPRAIQAERDRRRVSAGGTGLLLIANNFSTGGAQSSARRLLTGLAAEGVRVRAAVLEEDDENPTPGRRALVAAGIPVLALPPAGSIDPAAAVADLLEHIDGDPPEAVLLWNAIAEYKILVADALLDIPVFDVSPGEMYFTALERYFARPRPGLPYRTAAEYGARLAGVIVKYRAEAGLAAATLGTAVHVIPNGVPIDIAPVPVRSNGERLVIGTAARINPQKKLEDLFAAIHRAHKRLPPYVLRIAGGVERGCDEYAGRLRQLADGLPVEWLGEVQQTQPFLRGLDLFAQIAEPAGCPNASLEAMAAGLVVITTNVGGAAEQVEDSVTGRLVNPADPDALAAALVELAWDKDRRTRWGAAGRARVREHFDQARMVADYRRVCLGNGRTD